MPNFIFPLFSFLHFIRQQTQFVPGKLPPNRSAFYFCRDDSLLDPLSFRSVRSLRTSTKLRSMLSQRTVHFPKTSRTPFCLPPFATNGPVRVHCLQRCQDGFVWARQRPQQVIHNFHKFHCSSDISNTTNTDELYDRRPIFLLACCMELWLGSRFESSPIPAYSILFEYILIAYITTIMIEYERYFGWVVSNHCIANFGRNTVR